MTAAVEEVAGYREEQAEPKGLVEQRSRRPDKAASPGTAPYFTRRVALALMPPTYIKKSEVAFNLLCRSNRCEGDADRSVLYSVTFHLSGSSTEFRFEHTTRFTL